MEEEFTCKQLDLVDWPEGTTISSKGYMKLFNRGGCAGCSKLLDCDDLNMVEIDFLEKWACFGHSEKEIPFFENKVNTLYTYIENKIDSLYADCDAFAIDWVASVHGSKDGYKRFLKIIREYVSEEIDNRIEQRRMSIDRCSQK